MIPARMASSRLPGKPLVDLGGLPLIERVRRRARLSACAERVMVATEDPVIAEVVVGFGGEVIVTGPAANGTHRVAMAVGDRPVAVVNAQGDMPGLDPDHLDRVARALADGAEIVTLSAPWPKDADPSDPALVKVVPGLGFTRRPAHGARLHVGIYGFGPGVIGRAAACPPSPRSAAEDLEQLAWMDAGMPVTVLEVDGAEPGIDTPAQLEACRARWSTSG